MELSKKNANGEYIMTTFGGVIITYKNAVEGLLDWFPYTEQVHRDDKKSVCDLYKYIKKLKN